jgi:hypothetical protein
LICEHFYKENSKKPKSWEYNFGTFFKDRAEALLTLSSHEFLEFRPGAMFNKTSKSFQNLYSKILIG